MAPASLDFISIEPETRADTAIIMMHGLGADAHDFETLPSELDLPPSPSIRWILPHAPVRPVTVNGGARMRAWYDIVAIDAGAAEDEQGIRASQREIGALIQGQRELGISPRRIVVAGFSQGAAMALFTALRWPEPLAGVAALSGYLPLPRSLAAEAHPSNARTPVFMAHGSLDPVVPPALAEMSRDALSAGGWDVAWRTYPMAHAVCEEELADLRTWLLMSLSG